jgi:hypothetical protein
MATSVPSPRDTSTRGLTRGFGRPQQRPRRPEPSGSEAWSRSGATAPGRLSWRPPSAGRSEPPPLPPSDLAGRSDGAAGGRRGWDFPRRRRLPVYLLVAAHDFSAGRWDGRWAGLGGPIALSAASELAAALAHDSQGLFVFIVLAASAAGGPLREGEQLAALWDKETRFWLAAWVVVVQLRRRRGTEDPGRLPRVIRRLVGADAGTIGVGFDVAPEHSAVGQRAGLLFVSVASVRSMR